MWETGALQRVRAVSLTPKGEKLIAPVFRKHAAEIKKVFADASPKELRTLETVLKKLASVPRIWGPESIQSVYANDEIAV